MNWQIDATTAGAVLADAYRQLLYLQIVEWSSVGERSSDVGCERKQRENLEVLAPVRVWWFDAETDGSGEAEAPVVRRRAKQRDQWFIHSLCCTNGCMHERKSDAAVLMGWFHADRAEGEHGVAADVAAGRHDVPADGAIYFSYE